MRPIEGSHSWQHGDGVTEIIEADGASLGTATESCLVLPDPPVERAPDASVRWIHTLRTIHLHSGYLPVPTGARFRYPRFVGRTGPLAIPTVIHETGQEGWSGRIENITGSLETSCARLSSGTKRAAGCTWVGV